jgi:SAM-dependent methyltransferase
MTTDVDYFEARKVAPDNIAEIRLPPWADLILPKALNARILDIGCGQGSFMLALKRAGYDQVEGLEVDEMAVAHCRACGLTVHEGNILSADMAPYGRYDLITMQHVLEHLPKDRMIETLRKLKEMLTEGGALYLAVPNAQANTGAYWAFEDFTHTFLFTSGSLYFVGRKAGYREIEFIDIDCTAGDVPWARYIRRILLFVYKMNIAFWNCVTQSFYHRPSVRIYSYEIKAILKP